MIYDCFTFFNELDLLEIRLNELDRAVDKFVIVEATRTFTNKPKNLIFEENKARFSKFLHKIEHIVVDDFPEFTNAWDYEYFQRNAIARGLLNCKPDDDIIVSDVDEIPTAEYVLQNKGSAGVKTLGMLMFYYFINCINRDQPLWLRTRMLPFKDYTTAQEVRFMKGEYSMGGWHFSFLGGIENIKLKIESFAHQEYNSDYFKDPARLKQLISQGKDLFDREFQYDVLELNDSFPQYLLENLDKFAHLCILPEDY